MNNYLLGYSTKESNFYRIIKCENFSCKILGEYPIPYGTYQIIVYNFFLHKGVTLSTSLKDVTSALKCGDVGNRVYTLYFGQFYLREEFNNLINKNKILKRELRSFSQDLNNHEKANVVRTIHNEWIAVYEDINVLLHCGKLGKNVVNCECVYEKV